MDSLESLSYFCLEPKYSYRTANYCAFLSQLLDISNAKARPGYKIHLILFTTFFHHTHEGQLYLQSWSKSLPTIAVLNAIVYFKIFKRLCLVIFLAPVASIVRNIRKDFSLKSISQTCCTWLFFFETKKLLIGEEFGFRQVHRLIELIITKYHVPRFLDVAKAFDKVWNNGLSFHAPPYDTSRLSRVHHSRVPANHMFRCRIEGCRRVAPPCWSPTRLHSLSSSIRL